MSARQLVHRPLRPARPGHDGEQVYTSMWKAAMAETWDEGSFIDEDLAPIEQVFGDIGRKITQRDAIVAATAVCWLGCNMGQALVHPARREIAAGRWDRDRAYFLAWCIENRRVPCVNSGIRSVEYMLAPESSFRTTRHFGDSPLVMRPMLSADDVEIIDHLMLWLATSRGQAFIRQCEAEINRLRDEERRRKAAEWERNRGAAARVDKKEGTDT